MIVLWYRFEAWQVKVTHACMLKAAPAPHQARLRLDRSCSGPPSRTPASTGNAHPAELERGGTSAEEFPKSLIAARSLDRHESVQPEGTGLMHDNGRNEVGQRSAWDRIGWWLLLSVLLSTAAVIGRGFANSDILTSLPWNARMAHQVGLIAV